MIVIVITVSMLAYAISNGARASATPRQQTPPPVRLEGSAPAGLTEPGVRALPPAPGESSQPLTMTITLNRTDEPGFQRFASALQDPSSPEYRHFVTQAQLADRFGPSQGSYDEVLSWLRAQGFSLVQGSANRLTITVRGSRAQAERAFAVDVGEYRVRGRSFYSNQEAPAVPARLAAEIQSVAGLSDLARAQTPPSPAIGVSGGIACFGSGVIAGGVAYLVALALASGPVGGVALFFVFVVAVIGCAIGAALVWNASGPDPAAGSSSGLGTGTGGFGGWHNNTDPANPQRVGLLEFDTFHRSDVADWVALTQGDPSIMGRLSEVPVNGGVANPGAGESEVLLDIATTMFSAPTTDTKYVVYDAPATSPFETVFNAMINDGDTVISNSWSQCEDMTAPSEVHAIDSVLQQAAASGISVFNGTGDHGSTCLDGSPNTVGVPVDSPNATAVGGSTLAFGPGGNYASESWWDGSASQPPSGQGGFGVSKVFTRPAYQNGLTTATGRSVPDVVAAADPIEGVQICQADAGGCPDGLTYGGTSMAAPEWAGMVAQLNEQLGHNVGNVNTALYPLALTAGFHTAASLHSDFTHVGLGSADYQQLWLALAGTTVGPVSAANSFAIGLRTVTGASMVTNPTTVPADGITPGTVRVDLLDIAGHPVSGKAVTLTPTVGSSAVVSGGSGPSDQDSGAVTFRVTDTVPETVAFTATDATDGVALTTHPTLSFVPPAATGASILASPATVPNDGASKATVTVYLQNALGRPAAGKTVALSTGGTNAVVSPANGQAVTASNGEATFTATDTTTETVLFTATDLTDGNLPVPGSANVTFEPQGGDSCSNHPPTPSGGFSVSRVATGLDYLRQKITEPGNISAGPCTGAQTPAFDPSGNMYVADTASGKITVFGPSSGSSSTGTPLPGTTFAPGFTLGGLAFGMNGQLYAGLYNTHGDYFADQIVQLNPATGAIERTIATGGSPGLAPCPGWIAVDPLSGDIFTTDNCFGFLASGQITRISHPDASPTVSSYANVGNGATGLAFAPDGTLYVAAAGSSTIIALSGTNTAQPGTATTVATPPNLFGVTVGNSDSHGHATTLYEITYTGTTNKIDLTTNPATISTIASGGSFNFSEAVGPDGCLYVNDLDTILKVSGPGLCGSATTTPELTLTGPGVGQVPTGSPVTFTARLKNATAPPGTAIEFVVSGANIQGKLVVADATGNATFTYSGVFPGNDTVTAVVVINGRTLTSAPVAFRWVAGKDTSFLSLNQSQGGGPVAQPAKLIATLTDLAQTPPAPIPNAAITISLGGQSCAATTDSSGNGSCRLAPSGPPGLVPLTASYAGSTLYTAATATDSFAVFALVAGQPPAITSASSATFVVGAAGSFTVVATGTPAPTLVQNGNVPSGVTFDPATGILAGTPAGGTVGSYPMTFTATNGIAPDATQAFTLKVVKAPTTTAVSAGPPAPALGTPVTFTGVVAPSAANTLRPTGTVSFFVDGHPTPAATVALIGGSASLTTAALGAGSHTVVAVYNGDANFAASSSTTAATTTVSCTNTVTGDHIGALIVSSGSVCILGAHVGGAVVVAKGASIDVENSTLTSITANSGPNTIRVCATSASGAVSVSGATGLVIIGDSGDAACPPNTIGGTLLLQNNTGGVEAINNTVGNLVASNNSGPGPYPGDTTTITGNHH